MRWALALMAALMICTVPAAMAAKPEKAPEKGKKELQDAPGRVAIAKANDKATFQKENTATKEFASGKIVRFTPADLSGMNDEEIGHGCVIGILDTERATPDGLEPGKYRVFTRKHGNHWQVFYCQKDDAVMKASDTTNVDGNEHKPKFEESGQRLHYWFLKFSY